MDSECWNEVFACAHYCPALRTVCRAWNEIYCKLARLHEGMPFSHQALVVALHVRDHRGYLSDRAHARGARLPCDEIDAERLLKTTREEFERSLHPRPLLQSVFAAGVFRLVQKHPPSLAILKDCVAVGDAQTLRTLLQTFPAILRDEGTVDALARASCPYYSSSNWHAIPPNTPPIPIEIPAAIGIERRLECASLILPDIGTSTRRDLIAFLCHWLSMRLGDKSWIPEFLWMLGFSGCPPRVNLRVSRNEIFKWALFHQPPPCPLALRTIEHGWMIEEGFWSFLDAERMIDKLSIPVLCEIYRRVEWARVNWVAMAASRSRWDLFFALLEKEPDVDPAQHDQQALRSACRNRDYAVLERLLQHPGVHIPQDLCDYPDGKILQIFKRSGKSLS